MPLPLPRTALAANMLVAARWSTPAAAECPDDLEPDTKRACRQAELEALDGAPAASTATPDRPTLKRLGGRSYQMDDAIVGWKDIQPALDPRASEVAARAKRRTRTSTALGISSIACVGIGVAMFSQGGLGSGNAGSGVRAWGAAVGSLGGGDFLAGSLIARGSARRARAEAVGVYGVSAALHSEGGGLRLVGGF